MVNKVKNIFHNDGYSASILRKFIVILCTVCSTTLIARCLGPSLKGDYTFFLSIVHITVIFAQCGIFKLYPQYKRKYSQKCGDYFFTICVLKFAGLFAVSVVSVFIIAALKLDQIYYLLPFVICLDTLQGELVFLLLVDSVGGFNLTQIISNVSYVLSIALIYLVFPKNIYIVIVAFMIKDSLLILISTIIRKWKMVIDSNINRIITDNLKIIMYPVMAALLLDLNYKVDVFFLKSLSTSYYLGIYSTGVSVSEIAWMVPDVFKEVLFNRTSENDSVDQINRSMRLSNTFVLMIIVVLLFGGRFAIALLFGKDYEEAYCVTNLLMLGVLSMSTFKILNPLVQAKGKWKLYTETLLLSVIANMVLNALTIPHFGINGAAISSVVSYSLCAGILLVDYTKEYHVCLNDIVVVNKKDIYDIICSIKKLMENNE